MSNPVSRSRSFFVGYGYIVPYSVGYDCRIRVQACDWTRPCVRLTAAPPTSVVRVGSGVHHSAIDPKPRRRIDGSTPSKGASSSSSSPTPRPNLPTVHGPRSVLFMLRSGDLLCFYSFFFSSGKSGMFVRAHFEGSRITCPCICRCVIDARTNVRDRPLSHVRYCTEYLSPPPRKPTSHVHVHKFTPLSYAPAARARPAPATPSVPGSQSLTG